MTDEQKLSFGIEIVSAIKASCYDWDIESGRIDALMETEIDRLEGVSKEEWNNLTKKQQDNLRTYCKHEKERLHKQALFVADIALKFLGKEASNG